LSFVNFQEKLTGTSWNLFLCEASLFGLLCAWREVQILRQQRPSSDLKPELRTCPDPLDVPCTYHKGARYTLRGCWLRKKIDQECSPVPRELPHLRMAVSSRRSGSTSPPTIRAPSFAESWWFLRMNHHVAVQQISRRRGGFRATPTAPSDVRKSSVVRYLLALESFVSSLRKRGYRHSTAPRPTWVLPWRAFSKPTPHPRLKQPWLTFGLPRPWWRRRV
jgi:hypothetical protein